MMGKNLLEKLQSKLDAGMNLSDKKKFILLLLAGILLLVLTIPTPSSAVKKERELSERTVEEKDWKKDWKKGSYENYLEQKTEKILSEVEGAGHVAVMITLKSEGQKLIEKDRSSVNRSTEEEDGDHGVRNIKETTMQTKTIFSKTKDGEESPFICQQMSPEIEGVVVIADGGDNGVVVQNLTEAIQALFHVEPHKIKIMKRA